MADLVGFEDPHEADRALTELARFLPRGTQHNRYLRTGMRPHHRDEEIERRAAQSVEPTAELPAVVPPTPVVPRL